MPGLGRPRGRDHHIRTDGVADIGEIPPRLEVANSDFGQLETRFDCRDLPSEPRRRGRVLPRTEVVERPRNGDLHSRSGMASQGSCASCLP